jgi:CubicO group peptidase (beta-lactamase class C family)
MPGCQLLYAVNNKVIYDKSFGYFTYDSTRAVTNNDIYDIASVTKMASSALAAMLLFEKHKLDPMAKASKYLPELRHSNKKDITIDQLMAHEAGLIAWIPFYKSTIDSNGLSAELYRKVRADGFNVQISDSLFLKDNYKDTIWKTIIESEVNPPGKYVYSDLGLIILQHIIEHISGTTIDEYVTDNFYKPMGLWQTGYQPLKRFDKSMIVPTEIDSVFRKCLVQGYVHDPAAIMLGGVAGHAGVFTNAQSLAAIMKMLLDGGMYGGKRFLKKETILRFTSQAFPGTENRRGFIFDKPEPDATKNGPTAKSASLRTFGHTGFTGTCAWADPEHNIIFIFLSNRVYPSAANNKLAKLNIRTDLMQVLYDGLNIK